MAEMYTQPRRRWFRFSLRMMLLFVVAIGVSIGWMGHRAKEQRIALSAMETMGCRIAYRARANSRSPNALERCRSLLGEEPWIDVEYLIGANEDFTDAGLAHVRGLPRLRGLSLKGSSVTDAGLVHLHFLPMLSELNLARTQLTDSGLANLQGLSQLKLLALQQTRLTDAGLARLRGLKRLEWLDVSETQVTEAGVRELNTALPKLYIVH